MAERQWVGLGDEQHVSTGRLQAANAEFDRRYGYALASEQHLWVVTLAHYASPHLLEAFSGAEVDEPPMLDSETLVRAPVVGCYVCEQLWDPRLRHRKCPGEPKPPPKWSLP